MSQMLEKYFKLEEHGSSVGVEFQAALTNFLAMSFIVIVNPIVLSAAGMDFGAVLVATALGTAFACILMGLYAKFPFALGPSMSLNAYFTYVLVLGMGLSWQGGMAAVFISGVIFLILTLTKAREKIINSIPFSLKMAITAGIGLFITLLGLSNCGIIKPDANIFFALGDFTDPTIIVAAIGLITIAVMLVKKVKGAFLYGILIVTVVGIPLGVTNLDPIASGRIISMPPSLAPTFGAFIPGFKEVMSFGIIPIIFAFTFVDLFDTVGSLIGLANQSGYMDKDGKIPNINKALTVDSIATMVGATLGTTTITTFLTSASGIAAGGRTGLTAIFTGLLFLGTIFVTPLVDIIPAVATGPVLVFIGLLMLESIMGIDFKNYLEAIPAFFAIIMMPFTYSVAWGIVFGILMYTFIHVLTGRYKEISITMWILTILFALRLVMM